uniref:Chymotrypsin-like protease CTRL-1 n=2 Tax=Schistocephalus solidus TaxID=70667 RepID=A0A0X3PIC8_SCHSO
MMNIFIAAGAYFTVLPVIANAVEIEPGFPTGCGVPAVEREYKEEAEHMKVPATPKSWPWHVGLFSSSLGFYPYCGGTLISDTLILTAAHCLQIHFHCTVFPVGTEFQVEGATGFVMYALVGAHDFTRGDGLGQFHTVQRAIVHPNFNINLMKESTDLAILKMGSPIMKSDAAQPICFPSSRFHLSRGVLCYFTGWGRMYTPWSQGQLVRPKKLREAEVEVDFDLYCLREFDFYKIDRHSCIRTAGTSPCYADSGGGLFCRSEDGNKWIWYGAIISGKASCLGGWAVVNNFSSAHSWIRDSALYLGI